LYSMLVVPSPATAGSGIRPREELGRLARQRGEVGFGQGVGQADRFAQVQRAQHVHAEQLAVADQARAGGADGVWSWVERGGHPGNQRATGHILRVEAVLANAELEPVVLSAVAQFIPIERVSERLTSAMRT
jgi:hypothetical protein